MRESKNACNDPVIVAGVPVFRFIAGNPESVLPFDTIQKVYYPETKSTFIALET